MDRRCIDLYLQYSPSPALTTLGSTGIMEDRKTATEPDSSNGHLIQSTFIKPQARKLHDPAVTWEEYNYYAQRTREYEKTMKSPKLQLLTLLTRRKESAPSPSDSNGNPVQSAQIDLNLAKQENRLRISDEEWVNASRAYRTASWGACFYLVRNFNTISSVKYP